MMAGLLFPMGLWLAMSQMSFSTNRKMPLFSIAARVTRSGGLSLRAAALEL